MGRCVVTIQDVRTYTKDLPEYNFLSQGSEESTAELIDLCAEYAIEYFNHIAPVTTFSIDDFPQKGLLMQGICWQLAMSEMQNQVRNQITYSAQGLTAGINDKAQLYQQLAEMHKYNFLQGAKEYKQYLNIAQAWGGSASPYVAVNRGNFRT